MVRAPRHGIVTIGYSDDESYCMDTDLIHLVMAVTFFGMWILIGHITVARRRS